VLIRLTQAGRDLVDEVLQAHLANERRILGGLTTEERVSLSALPAHHAGAPGRHHPRLTPPGRNRRPRSPPARTHRPPAFTARPHAPPARVHRPPARTARRTHRARAHRPPARTARPHAPPPALTARRTHARLRRQARTPAHRAGRAPLAHPASRSPHRRRPRTLRGSRAPCVPTPRTLRGSRAPCGPTPRTLRSSRAPHTMRENPTQCATSRNGWSATPGRRNEPPRGPRRRRRSRHPGRRPGSTRAARPAPRA